MTPSALSHQDLVQAVADVVARLPRFRARRGAHVEGHRLSVEVVPRYRDPALRDLCDLEVSVRPCGLPADTPAEMVAGAREAFQVHLQDPDPRIRAAAALAMEQMNAPRVRGGDLEGIELVLELPEGRMTARTNAAGRALFRNVSARADVRLTPAQSSTVRKEEPRILRFPTARGSLPALPKSGPLQAAAAAAAAAAAGASDSSSKGWAFEGRQSVQGGELRWQAEMNPAGHPEIAFMYCSTATPTTHARGVSVRLREGTKLVLEDEVPLTPASEVMAVGSLSLAKLDGNRVYDYEFQVILTEAPQG